MIINRTPFIRYGILFNRFFLSLFLEQSKIIFFTQYNTLRTSDRTYFMGVNCINQIISTELCHITDIDKQSKNWIIFKKRLLNFIEKKKKQEESLK